MNSVCTAFITVFNEEEYIAGAVESLLSQSLFDVEVLIVDDGSTDRTLEIVRSFDDPRVCVLTPGRLRRAGALAYAADQARGEFLANLDADDEAAPERLAEQVNFLRQHPDHVWVGCAEDRHDTQRGERYVRRYPERDAEIRRLAARCIPYCHSGVMFRKALVDQGVNYDPVQPYLIDFEFFLRVASHGKVANLPDPLVTRRARGESYFQRTFSCGAQNRQLSAFCRQAIKAFDLPYYHHIYPAVRMVYPWLPTALKRRIRASQGLSEET
jgi:glycosyltransferase EpsE